jgi:hypothetical protein
MERREKHLLKNRIKRIKIHSLIANLPSDSKNHIATSKVEINLFKVSPIKITIPEFSNIQYLKPFKEESK